MNKPTYEQLQAQVKQLGAERDAVVAENVGLRGFGDKLYSMYKGLETSGGGFHDEQSITYQQAALDAAMSEFEGIKTPATDEYAASLRAEGVEWIEGNTPEKFGRYWVRYETEVGPRYCSAQWIEHNFCASSNTNIHKIWLADHSRSINSLKGVTHYTRLPQPIEGGAK